MAPSPNYSEVVVGGVKTACVTRAGLAKLMVSDCLTAREKGSHPKLVFSVNGNSIARATFNRGFRRLYHAADIIHADGQPVVFASKFTRTPIPERSATTDFFHDACEAANRNGLRVYLIGGTEDGNCKCAERVAALYPGLAIAGRRHGYFSAEDEASICCEINSVCADIVWVGLGLPREQEFCLRNRERLHCGWLVTSGGCFNFVTGAYSRAPRWMQRSCLEWLYRLWKDPKRLALRYAVTNPVAIFMLLARTHAISNRHDTRVPSTTMESEVV